MSVRVAGSKRAKAVDLPEEDSHCAKIGSERPILYARARASLDMVTGPWSRDQQKRKSGRLGLRDKSARLCSREKSGRLIARERSGKIISRDKSGILGGREKSGKLGAREKSGKILRDKTGKMIACAATNTSRGDSQLRQGRSSRFGGISAALAGEKSKGTPFCETSPPTTPLSPISPTFHAHDLSFRPGSFESNTVRSSGGHGAADFELRSASALFDTSHEKERTSFWKKSFSMDATAPHTTTGGPHDYYPSQPNKSFMRIARPLKTARGKLEAAVANTRPQNPNVSGSPSSDHDLPKQWIPGTWSLLESKYDITSKLGSGAFGEVYLGSRRPDGLPVAVKVYYREQREISSPTDVESTGMSEGLLDGLNGDHEDFESLDGLDESTQNELRYADLGLSHPNIVQILATIRNSRGVSLVMELMGDGDLRDRMDSRQRIPEKDTKEIVLRILEALAYLHKRGVIHRDIKPENILFNRALKNDAKLADLGLCWMSEENGVPAEGQVSSTRANGAYGSPYYMAPEVADEARAYGVSADLWSLGVMVYEMLSGELPFTGRTTRAVLRKSAKGRIPFSDSIWTSGTLDSQAMPFIRQLLSLDPRVRGLADSLRTHPWLDRNSKTIPRAPRTKLEDEYPLDVAFSIDSSSEENDAPHSRSLV